MQYQKSINWQHILKNMGFHLISKMPYIDWIGNGKVGKEERRI